MYKRFGSVLIGFIAAAFMLVGKYEMLKMKELVAKVIRE